MRNEKDFKKIITQHFGFLVLIYRKQKKDKTRYNIFSVPQKRKFKKNDNKEIFFSFC
jgi:hypothetical protein